MSNPVPAIMPVSAALRAYGANATPSADFGSMVSGAARDALATLRRAEVVSARGVAGTADVQEVVQAASAAELTVQTMTQLRDKVVGAYSDVLRMAV
ncbi:flagellar hook-basal body complex protein FliE [Roseomonas marmotae]|uniref:Flagellar hook-basal body complex protein FliE n=1 Tax=Roseomonas marmotae TaxID=2768161 RepID=A0ABS3KII6_9PROT|nr:flagellar hook-basal body complex protein FliE [Roseomonas marmotae]MBO1076131.1 flagellar hook-basal body complex protein FliE [Roseomonas marmotae]QTI81265.1 flagellar hook-basal body complex protein FliE [Roseomonas marmotae]